MRGSMSHTTKRRISGMEEARQTSQETELLALLREVQQRCIILRPHGRTVAIWSSFRVPVRLRRAISRYRREILTMIQRSEIYVCPSPDLHRHSWGWQLC